MELSSVIYIFATVITLLYFFSKWKFTYWKNKNVYHPEPTFFYGNLKDVFKRKIHMSDLISELYNETKSRGEKYCGIFSFWSPQFIPVDLELIKCILQKDFSHFTNHGFYVNEEKDPLSGHLFNLENEKWRNLRAKLTPTFTSGKMKMMFQTMVDCTTGLQGLLQEAVVINEPIDIKELLIRFTTDVIGSVAFGLEINSMKNPDNDFRKYGKRIFERNFRARVNFIVLNLFPRKLLQMTGFKFFAEDIESFFINLVQKTVDYRENNNVFRKDFMHLLIQLKNLGKVTDDEEELLVQNTGSSSQGLTINEMAAQTFVFFIAGFETSATTMTFALLELGQNQEIQEKLRREIQDVLKKHDNKITYDSIMEMEYLEKVVLETLRKHPPVSLLPRSCNKDYKVPDSDLVIKSGTGVTIPVLSIHKDPELYPDPEKFDPERFNEENKATRNPFSYMPFGEGPRTCIGLRFGKLQAKVGLCSLLSNYNVTINEKTQFPIKYENFVITVKGGVWLNLEPLK